VANAFLSRLWDMIATGETLYFRTWLAGTPVVRDVESFRK